MSSGLSQFNRALNRIPRRAEQRQAEQLRETFVDSGVAVALDVIDNQVIYGRRGTGKTHALRYIESQIRARGDIAIYADLRTVGSPEGLFMGERLPPTERAGRLLVDLLGNVHDVLLQIAIDDPDLIADRAFVDCVDSIIQAASALRVDGDVVYTREGESRRRQADGFDAAIEISQRPSASLRTSSRGDAEESARFSENRSGSERFALNFSDIARALRRTAESLSSRRVWLLLDEWSSVPVDVQPLLGEFLVRCVTPVPAFTVKIAAIEQQSRFRAKVGERTVGIELGADFTANINLDEFMVYEANADRSIEFFRGLLYKHLASGAMDGAPVDGLQRASDLVRLGFTEKRAFEELVRSAEGVPRDAINIAAKAAFSADSSRISVSDVRNAARVWFQSDKEAALQGHQDAPKLLNWIVDNVIREKRARGFLVNQKSASSPLLLALFDARVLHLVRRGYSAQDEPGERYDVWVIDYGAYVDLIHTKYEPVALLLGDDVADGAGSVEVPVQDLRAIRRAVLDLDAFEASR